MLALKPASRPSALDDAHRVIIGDATLYLGDAYTLRPLIGRVDCDVLDPPYLFNNTGGGAFRKARGASDQIVAERLDKGFDPSIIDPALCGSVIVFCHNDQVADLIIDLADDGTDALLVSDMFSRLRQRFHRACILGWHKPNPSPHRNKHYLADLEPYIHAWHRDYHPVGAHADMSRIVTSSSGASKIYGHPTVKPDAVMDKIMRNINGDTVCDPFMGTGSTGVSAIKAGKSFIGIEHNPKHFETAVERITQATIGATCHDGP